MGLAETRLGGLDSQDQLLKPVETKLFFLWVQNLNYKLIFVEQLGNGPFNKGSLLNIGFIEAIKMELKIFNEYSESGNCQIFIFQYLLYKCLRPKI